MLCMAHKGTEAMYEVNYEATSLALLIHVHGVFGIV